MPHQGAALVGGEGQHVRQLVWMEPTTAQPPLRASKAEVSVDALSFSIRQHLVQAPVCGLCFMFRSTHFLHEAFT